MLSHRAEGGGLHGEQVALALFVALSPVLSFTAELSSGCRSFGVSVSDVFASDLRPKLQCYFQLFFDGAPTAAA